MSQSKPDGSWPLRSVQNLGSNWSLGCFWVNYNNSLTWIKPIWGWFPLLTMIPVSSQWALYNLPRCFWAVQKNILTRHFHTRSLSPSMIQWFFRIDSIISLHTSRELTNHLIPSDRVLNTKEINKPYGWIWKINSNCVFFGVFVFNLGVGWVNVVYLGPIFFQPKKSNQNQPVQVAG